MNKVEEAAESWRKEVGDFGKNIAFFSAGAISLSITFVGYVLAKKQGGLVLASSKHLWFFNFKLMYLLFVAWFLLLLSITSGLYLNLFRTKYIFLQEVGVKETIEGNLSKKRITQLNKWDFASKHILKFVSACFILGISMLAVFAASSVYRLL